MAGVTDATAVLEPPANPGFGDLATNVAMTLAKAAGREERTSVSQDAKSRFESLFADKGKDEEK